MQRDSVSTNFSLGSQLPSFTLPDVSGRMVSESFFEGSQASLVVFTCNHCPYVKGSDEMLLRIVREFTPAGLRVVAISSNDAAQYPEDSFEKMKEKAESQKLPFPYLYDESQQVARAFDAACTPECYLFDRTGALVWHGTINNSPRHPADVKSDFLSPAISAVLEGRLPDPQFVHPIGCSIKWK